jgi:hypothetical protein
MTLRRVTAVKDRLATVLDRVTATAERHATPTQALTALLLVVALTGATLTVIAARSDGQSLPQWAATESRPDPPAPAPAPAREPPRPIGIAPDRSPPPALRPMPAGDFVGWALLDQRDGTITGSENRTATSTTASMIKAWIAADYLRRTAEAGDQPSPARLDQLTQVIRDSNNEYAEEIFRELGAHESIERLLQICGLTDSYAIPYRWSNTELSPRDTVRMGACIVDGRAAGPEWTDWLLDEMRAVRGVGDFGIRKALPADQQPTIAIKNGWVVRDSQEAWHVNCLAIGDGWVMGVMTRYPANLGYEHGAEICQSLATDHLPADLGVVQPDSSETDLDNS